MLGQIKRAVIGKTGRKNVSLEEIVRKKIQEIIGGILSLGNHL